MHINKYNPYQNFKSMLSETYIRYNCCDNVLNIFVRDWFQSVCETSVLLFQCATQCCCYFQRGWHSNLLSPTSGIKRIMLGLVGSEGAFSVHVGIKKLLLTCHTVTDKDIFPCQREGEEKSLHLNHGHERRPKGETSFIINDLLSSTMYFQW